MGEVRIGIVGLGTIGRTHCGYMRELVGGRLSAVCDTDVRRIDKARSDSSIRFGAEVAAFSDYRKMIRSGTIDLLMVCVPHLLHAEITVDAMRQGLHVICEKPLAPTAEVAKRVIEVHKECGGSFSVMLQERASEVNIGLRNLVRNGVLGGVRRINWISTDWFRTQFYYRAEPWRGSWNREGGGVLINQSLHDLDLFQWLFGRPSIISAMVYLGKWHDITVEDEVAVSAEMENGAHATLSISSGDFPPTSRLEILCDKGKIIYEKGKAMLLLEPKRPIQEIIDRSSELFYTEKCEAKSIDLKEDSRKHQKITQSVVNGIRKVGEPLTLGEEGLDSVQLANTILYAGLTGLRVKYPVSDEVFSAFHRRLCEDESRGLDLRQSKTIDHERHVGE
ncbi:MAG: Gfo/Idh/MocA family oxidoreductase [Chloroflexi bacterium]|nr:Gfo/Idh/MocA family oxidoreductase [Chloroflexota bacterium]